MSDTFLEAMGRAYGIAWGLVVKTNPLANTIKTNFLS